MKNERLSDAREWEMVALWRSGISMAEIGEAVGLSRERVRQLLKRHGVTGRASQGWVSRPLTEVFVGDRAREARQARRKDRASWRRRLVVWLVRDIADTSPGRVVRVRQVSGLLWRSLGPTAHASALSAYLGVATRESCKIREVWRDICEEAGASVAPLGASGHRVRGPRPFCRRGHPASERVPSGGCRVCRRARYVEKGS